MRPIYLCDLDAVVRAVLTVPEAQWPDALGAVVACASAADQYRKRFGKPHPKFGTGTLTSAVTGQKRQRVTHIDADYRRCMRHLLDALDVHSAHQFA